MANKYHLRRRALKEIHARSDKQLTSRRDRAAWPNFDAPPLPVDRPWIAAGVCCGFVLLITVLYVQTARHDFTVCDDNDYIWRNAKVMQGLNPDGTSWAGVKWAWEDSHAGNWHPLTWMSHMLDWQLFGKWQSDNQRYVNSWAGGHHLVNMGIHCANAVLLFLALRLMTGTLWPCVVVTALFAAHPLRVESVAWAAERKDVLCGLFWMASMLTYAWYARRRPFSQSSPEEAAGTLAIYSLITLLFGLALLAKSMAVTLPCVFLLLDAWPLNRWRNALWPSGPSGGLDFISATRLLLEKLPWFAMVVYDCQQTVIGQDKGVALCPWDGLPLGPRVFNALLSLAAYLGQLFWPAGMAVFYPHMYILKSGWSGKDGWSGWGPGAYCQAVIGGIIVFAIAAAAICFWRKGYLAVGWFWFLGTLLPVIGILQVGTQSRADRYTYLPMIGVYVMIVWLVKEAADRWPRTRIALAGASVLVFTMLSAITFQQVSYWVNSYVLFEHAVDVTDQNWFAYNHLGIQYDHDGLELVRPDPTAGSSLEDTRSYALKKHNLETAESQAAKDALLDLAGDSFRKSLVVKPDYDFGNNNLGVYYARKSGTDDLALAEKYFRAALQSNPRYADAFSNLAIILRREGKLDESIVSSTRGLEVRYDRASDHNNLCETYMEKGDLKSALRENAIALQCDRNLPIAWMNGAKIFIAQKNLDEAAQCVQRLTEIDAKAPETVQSRMLLAAAKNLDRNDANDTDDPQFMGIWMNLLLLHLKQNHLPDVAMCAKHMIAIDPLLARCGLGAKYAELKRFDEAIDWFTQALAIRSDLPQVYFARGEIYEKKGDLNRAKEDYQEVVRLAPQEPVAQQKLNSIRARLANRQH